MVEVKSRFFWLTLVLIALIAISTVDAEITPTVSLLDSDAKAGETLRYKLNFYNYGTVSEKISLNLLFGEPTFSETSFEVGPGETRTIDLSILIDGTTAENFGTMEGKTTYQQVLLFDENGKKIDYLVLIPTKLYSSIKEPSKYSAIAITDIKTNPVSVDPRTSFDIVFTIKNPTNFTPMASFGLITDKGAIDFPSIKIVKGEAEYVINDVHLMDSRIVGAYDVVLRMVVKDFLSDNKIVLNVATYGDCVVNESVEAGILGKEYSAVVKNSGTKTEKCLVSTNVYGVEKRLITKTSEGYLLKGSELSWIIELSPGESATVSYTSSYIPVLAIPFIIIGFVLVYWYMTRKVLTIKELIDYKRHPEFLDLKLQVRVTNVSSTDLENVKVYEMLPSFVKEVKEFGTVIGSLTKRKGQQAIRWDVDNLKAKEERVFSYKVRTRVVVLGKMNFAPTVVEYKDKKGRVVEATSNVLAVEVQ